MTSLKGPIIKLAAFIVVTVLATVILANTISRGGAGGGTEYHALFEDAALLNQGDEVRIAGVQVGTVSKIELDQSQGRALARVSFELNNDRELPEGTAIYMRYRNLIGQRYLALERGPGGNGRPLPSGTTIGDAETHEAVNLTELFGGFKPLFTTLQPEQVNTLTEQLIKVFQGEAGTVGSLVQMIGQLTQTLADKDEVIGRVITNLRDVLGTVNEKHDEFDAMIINTTQLMQGLAEDKDSIGNAVTALDALTNTAQQTLAPSRSALKDDLVALNDVAQTANAHEEQINSLLNRLPEKLTQLVRMGSYGSWFQFYLCGIDVVLGPGNDPLYNVPDFPTINQPIITSTADRCWQKGTQP